MAIWLDVPYHRGQLCIHSFIHAIYVAPLQVHYYSEVLPTQHGCCAGVSCRSTTGNYKSVKDLPKVPAWWLERDSNLQPFRRMASNLLMSHYTPQIASYVD